MDSDALRAEKCKAAAYAAFADAKARGLPNIASCTTNQKAANVKRVQGFPPTAEANDTRKAHPLDTYNHHQRLTKRVNENRVRYQEIIQDLKKHVGLKNEAQILSPEQWKALPRPTVSGTEAWVLLSQRTGAVEDHREMPHLQYSPLFAEPSIRLLKFHMSPTSGKPYKMSFELAPFVLSQCPPFKALSYTWGKQD